MSINSFYKEFERWLENLSPEEYTALHEALDGMDDVQTFKFALAFELEAIKMAFSPFSKSFKPKFYKLFSKLLKMNSEIQIIPPKHNKARYTENLAKPSGKAKKAAWDAAVGKVFKH